MTWFEIIIASCAIVSTGALLLIGAHLADIRKDVTEIWKRMRRLD